MGNLQSNDPKSGKTGKTAKVKTLMKIRGKKGKQEDNQFTGLVPEETEEQEHASASEDDLTVTEARAAKTTEDATKNARETADHLVITDSWRKVNQYDTNNLDTVTPSGDSSSDSVFAEALTPVGFSAEINQCYRSEETLDRDGDDFLHDLTLNSFKLNDHRARKQEVIERKLSKLGVSKTSQISLEADPGECFSSGNVEVVTKEESPGVGDESGFGGSNVLEDSTEGEDADGVMGPQKVMLVSKRLSDTGISNGKSCVIRNANEKVI